MPTRSGSLSRKGSGSKRRKRNPVMGGAPFAPGNAAIGTAKVLATTAGQVFRDMSAKPRTLGPKPKPRAPTIGNKGVMPAPPVVPEPKRKRKRSSGARII